MPRRLPSFNGLKAFEAAARHESFTRAAEELFVTPRLRQPPGQSLGIAARGQAL
jgi:Bacterial regulatory helix-turn-helix protein, lysR family